MIPSHLGYLLVLPFNYYGCSDSSLNDTIPYVITYTDNTKKLSQIIDEIHEIDDSYKDSWITLTLRGGQNLRRESTLL